MSEESSSSATPGVTRQGCGHEEKPRRICDVCRSLTHVYTACSVGCLQAHIQEQHADLAQTDLLTRVRRHQRAMNSTADNWDRYAPHRQQVMELIPRVAQGALCVFGAGTCSDIDLEELASSFAEVHLVDFDDQALERARERQPEGVRKRVFPHGGVDLSGFLTQIESFGETFPTDEELGPRAVQHARDIIGALGRTFDVTVSSCVLSQLIFPFQRSLAASSREWISLEAALTGVHLTTLAGATQSGGHCRIVFDVLSASDAPGLLDLKDNDASEIQAFVMREVDPQRMRPDPWNLVKQLSAPGLGSLFTSPRLTSPWLWDIQTDHQLVYGLAFERS